MATCSPCSSKGHFACAFLVEVFLPTLWFCLHYSLTCVHEKDPEIINYAGSLRYHTQSISTVLLSQKYLPTQSSTMGDPFQQLCKIVDALLGKASLRKDDGTEAADIEMVDEDVRHALEQWVHTHLDPIQAMYANLYRVSQMHEAQVSQMVDSVTAAIEAVDDIVVKAVAASESRVRILVIVSILRAIMGLLWAVVSFGNAWRPYVATDSRLQVLEQQSASILRAAFDALVEVSAARPFNIVACSASFDHLLGQSMEGKSLLSCADGPTEEQQLAKLLGSAQQAHEQLGSRLSSSERLCWWNMLPRAAPERLPVAAMISTRWRCGPAEARSRVKVEVLAASRPATRSSTLVVVRRVPGDSGHMPPGHEEAPALPRPEEAFVPIAVQATTPTAPSLLHTDSQSASTGGTAVCLGVGGRAGTAGTLSPRSCDHEQTPPPSTLNGMGATRQGQLSTEFALAVTSAVQGMLRGSLDDSSSSVATPPMF